MSASTILVVYGLFFFLELGWDTTLTLLNMAHVRAHAAAVPSAFVGAIDGQTWSRSVSYTLSRGRLALAAGIVSSAAVLAAVLSGSFGILDNALRSLPVHPHLQGVLFIACLAVLSWLIGLPFRLYSTFRIEARFGFNRSTPRVFIADTAKGLALSALLGIPVLLGLFWMMAAAGRSWWVWAFLATSTLQLGISLLYPLVIAPLFNRFTPLEPGPLRDAIHALAQRLGVRAKAILVMDGSRRSRHSNAYFTGLGRSKRIVLFDTLLAGSSATEEILSVLSHEMGHEKRRHVVKRLAVSLAASLAFFWIASVLLDWQPLFRAFGFSSPSPHGLFALLAFCAGPFTFFLTPLSSLWSRRHEYEADRFAVDAMGSADGMKAALLRLARENLANLAPHPLYSFFHYSHPTLAERIAALDAHASRAS